MIMVPWRAHHRARDVTFLDQTSPPGAEPSAPAPAATMTALHDARDRFERDYILRALAAQQGNISRTADALGIERSNLYRKMRAFGIMPTEGERRRMRLSGKVEKWKSGKVSSKYQLAVWEVFFATRVLARGRN
jgi:hypothetical protein